MQDNRGFSELDEACNGLSINNFLFFLGWPRFSGKLVFKKKAFLGRSLGIFVCAGDGVERRRGHVYTVCYTVFCQAMTNAVLVCMI